MRRALFLLLFSGAVAAATACDESEADPPTDQSGDGGANDGAAPADATNPDAPTEDDAAPVDAAPVDAAKPDADAGGGDADAEVPIPCTCAAGQGCLVLTVDRLASDTAMPWTKWPTEADGRGALVATAHSIAAPIVALAQRTVADVDLRTASTTYSVDLGCLAEGTVESFVFLDDNENTQSGAMFSDDYRDTCGRPGPGVLTIESQKTTAVTYTLKGSCD